MIQKVVDRIVVEQVDNETIEQEEINIYKYGYFLVFSVLVNFIISVIVGIVFSDLLTVLVFLLFYIPLRSYSGGWHANRLWKCTLYSNLILVMIEVMIHECMESIPVMYLIPAVIMMAGYILLVSPIDTKSKPLCEEEKHIYRKKVKIIVLLHAIILLFLTYMQNKNGILIIEYVYLVQTVMLTLQRNTREK